MRYFLCEQKEKRTMFAMWVYVVVAAVIAIWAFAIGQVVPGLGVAFAAIVSTMWAAHVAHRGRTSRS